MTVRTLIGIEQATPQWYAGIPTSNLIADQPVVLRIGTGDCYSNPIRRMESAR
jgi:hypothetical protein